MPGIGQWQPAAGTHAIQLAAVGINFREPITSYLLENASEKVGKVAERLGLSERLPQHVGMLVPGNVPQQLQLQSVDFLRRERPDFFSDKLSLSRNSLRFEEWAYTRWAVTAEKVNALFTPVFDVYTSATPAADIYVEYLDLFLAPLESTDSARLIIQEGSPFVAAGVASDVDPWHTHSGHFSPNGEPIRRLHQINIDVSTVIIPEGERRAVQIRTFVSEQASRPDRPRSAALTLSWPSISTLLDTLHECAKADFRDILTPEAAAAVSLG